MGKITDALVASADDIFEQIHEHPFVRGIGDGSLDKEKFKFYMIQDYLYLYDYSRVFAVGCAKARGVSAMRRFASSVSVILNDEAELHGKYMARLGVSERDAQRARRALDNISYTSYMLRVAYEGGAKEAAAAILSCAVSYEEIANRIIAKNPASSEHEFYGEWIRGYSSPEYATSNRELEAAAEDLCRGINESDFENLKTIFVNCSRYEKNFWDMAWEKRL